MNPPTVTKETIIEKLDTLPSETLLELEAFIEFLRFKSEKEHEQPRPEAWREALDATFGMWAGREDVPGDGVEYTQSMRQGHRSGELLQAR